LAGNGPLLFPLIDPWCFAWMAAFVVIVAVALTIAADVYRASTALPRDPVKAADPGGGGIHDDTKSRNRFIPVPPGKLNSGAAHGLAEGGACSPAVASCGIDGDGVDGGRDHPSSMVYVSLIALCAAPRARRESAKRTNF